MAHSIAQKARDNLAVAARRKDKAGIEAARRDLTAANLEQHIRRVADAAPPLTPAQRERLALLLHPGTDG